MSKGGVFEACLDITLQGDTEGLLECVSNRLESAQTLTSLNMNSYLLVLSGALVFFMQAGFAMLCAGSVRRKNAQVRCACRFGLYAATPSIEPF